MRGSEPKTGEETEVGAGPAEWVPTSITIYYLQGLQSTRAYLKGVFEHAGRSVHARFAPIRLTSAKN